MPAWLHRISVGHSQRLKSSLLSTRGAYRGQEEADRVPDVIKFKAVQHGQAPTHRRRLLLEVAACCFSDPLQALYATA